VWRNGVRLRKATVLDGDRAVYVEDVPVRRLRCGCCKARWSQAPEHVESRAHYQPAVVARAVAWVVVNGGPTALACEIGCDRGTLSRWVERVAKVAEPARLSRVLLAAADQPVLPALPTARTSQSARLTALGARAIAVLALLEALVSLHGLSPPGLAHSHMLVPVDAAPAAPTVIRGGGSMMACAHHPRAATMTQTRHAATMRHAAMTPRVVAVLRATTMRHVPTRPRTAMTTRVVSSLRGMMTRHAPRHCSAMA